MIYFVKNIRYTLKMITRLYCTIIKLAVHKEKQWLGDLVSLQAYTVSRGWWEGGGGAGGI